MELLASCSWRAPTQTPTPVFNAGGVKTQPCQGQYSPSINQNLHCHSPLVTSSIWSPDGQRSKGDSAFAFRALRLWRYLLKETRLAFRPVSILKSVFKTNWIDLLLPKILASLVLFIYFVLLLACIVVHRFASVCALESYTWSVMCWMESRHSRNRML